MRERKRAVLCLLAVAVLAIAAGAAAFMGKPQCKVIQYNDASGNQGQFYTIETEDGGLIVVDGGWRANVLQVREVIKSKGGVADAWILTHPHPDHIGAFNEVWKDPGEIVIKDVYTIDMDYDSYKKRAQVWDEFDIYEEFLEITGDSGQIHFLHTGDELQLCGLQAKVFNAYDKTVTNKLTKDLANDGSLIFKVTNKKESMLFCGDVGVKMSDTVMEQFGSELKCDYIQMGHHGNGGLSEEFYRMTSPKAAFFDAPEWLMNPEDPESTWTTPQNRELMEELGAEIYYYNTAPNQIELE